MQLDLGIEPLKSGVSGATAGMMTAGFPWGAAIGGAMGIGGGLLSNMFGHNESKRAREHQEYMARNFIQMRVQDANKAGIHPLYALGAPPMGGQPTQIMDDSLGPALREMGQDMGRLVDPLTKAKVLSDIKATESSAELNYVMAHNAREEERRNYLDWYGRRGSTLPARGSYAIEGQAASGIGPLHGDDRQVRPYWRPWSMSPFNDRMQIWLPESISSGPSEMLRGALSPELHSILDQNQEYFGGTWKEDFMRLRYGNRTGMEGSSPIPYRVRP